MICYHLKYRHENSHRPGIPNISVFHEERQRNCWKGKNVKKGSIMKIEFQPIGTIHTPFTKTEGMPIQPTGDAGVKGSIEIFEEYRRGLKDLDGFSHIILLYHFHRSSGFSLEVIPFMDNLKRGLFATRAPARPNPIGLSIVELDGIEDGILQIRNVDILDGTPLLDIKPYAPAFDRPAGVRAGWLEKTGGKVVGKRSDDRFSADRP